MRYKPKMLHNPTDEVKEFRCGGETFIFQPGEKRILDGMESDHALKKNGLGLVEFTGGETKVETPSEPVDITTSEVDYDKVPWKTLVAIGSKAGVFRPGMKKDELITALKGLDE